MKNFYLYTIKVMAINTNNKTGLRRKYSYYKQRECYKVPSWNFIKTYIFATELLNWWLYVQFRLKIMHFHLWKTPGAFYWNCQLGWDDMRPNATADLLDVAWILSWEQREWRKLYIWLLFGYLYELLVCVRKTLSLRKKHFCLWVLVLCNPNWKAADKF